MSGYIIPGKDREKEGLEKRVTGTGVHTAGNGVDDQDGTR